jgi:WD40 repeat protein
VADRYCTNCGHELAEGDRFCPNCGRPLHRTAHVPTPEADVPVPPPPHQRAEGTAPPPPQSGAPITQHPRSRRGLLTGLGALGAVILVGLVAALTYALLTREPATDFTATRTLTGHSEIIGSLAFASDGNLLASGGWDMTVKLWNPRTGELLQTLTGHSDVVDFVTFSPDGSHLASGGYDGTVMLWNPRIGGLLQTLTDTSGLGYPAFSPDGRLLATSGGDRTVKLWDPRTGELLQTLTGHSDSVWCVAFSPDGSLLASSSEDGTVKIWGQRPNASYEESAPQRGNSRDAGLSVDEEVGVEEAVRGHYQAIGAGKFEKAYSYFGPTFRSQIQNNKRGWINSEKSYQITGTTINALKVNGVSDDQATATVDFSVQDNTGTPRFLITWRLLKEDGQWKLDELVSSKKVS